MVDWVLVKGGQCVVSVLEVGVMCCGLCDDIGLLYIFFVDVVDGQCNNVEGDCF